MATIKDRIKAGEKPADLYASFMKELQSAQQEVEQEKKDAESKKVDEARDALIFALLDYAVAADWIDEELADDDDIWNDIEEQLKREERRYIKYNEFKDDDSIIREFIKAW